MQSRLSDRLKVLEARRGHKGADQYRTKTERDAAVAEALGDPQGEELLLAATSGADYGNRRAALAAAFRADA